MVFGVGLFIRLNALMEMFLGCCGLLCLYFVADVMVCVSGGNE